MMLGTQLPMLPGFSLSTTVGQERFPRAKFFDFKQGTQFYDPKRHTQTHNGQKFMFQPPPGNFEQPSGIPSRTSNEHFFGGGTATAEDLNYRSKSAMSFASERSGRASPGKFSPQATWGNTRCGTSLGLSHQAPVDFCDLVRFRAYFKEDMVHAAEPFRIHDCVLSCYLKDNTFSIRLRAQKNSGMTSGVILRRQACLDSDGNHKHPWESLRIGSILSIYGREYHLIDCDERTRNRYIDMLDVHQPEKMPIPSDPYQQRELWQEEMHDKRMNEQRQLDAFGHKRQGDSQSRFLEFDRQVLRFYCVWDDTTHQFGDKRFFAMHCYLCDMTIEIKELLGKNSGRFASGCFLSRQRLPRTYKLQDLSEHHKSDSFISDHNLRIGKTVNVFGKPFLLYDCDEFTKNYYIQNYGMTPSEFEPIDVSTAQKPPVVAPTPRHNGFGQELDTYENTKRLLPRRVKGDVQRWMKNDGQELRFEAKWVDAVLPFDLARRFCFTYYVGDGTCAIFENTAAQGSKTVVVPSKFLQRGLLKKDADTTFPQYYSHNDLSIGARIKVYGRTFELIDVDEASKKVLKTLGVPLRSALRSRGGSRGNSRGDSRGGRPDSNDGRAGSRGSQRVVSTEGGETLIVESPPQSPPHPKDQYD
eukprot:CAMPEP_0114552142 /NCGR_PEP_ID=MMETSP0114-20121206/6970_1 /TAXON_ID=31324 /ORGANISM="Goniomonas sp, Strain m" /LENGTH=640 /DNA_ID=CAMNT_0001737005 /DNA_START=31 /DNA_END=1953 /DNA_ORIENTATION=-